MSIILNDSPENLLKKNEEVSILREIFDLVEAKKENKQVESKNVHLLEKYHIKTIKLEKINGMESCPKNRNKSKLKKLLFKQNL